MLEQETENIIAALRDSTIGPREEVQLRDVLGAEIPRGVKRYVQAETLRWLRDELEASPKFARIDPRVPGVARLSRAFLLSLSEGYSYRREEYLGLLENAVHFLENYLCRPQWTIENFVFQEGRAVPVQTVLAKLEYTVEYSYFRTLIEKIAHQRGWNDIGLEEFRTLLVAIDDQVVKQHNPRELALLAKPIFDFILMRDTPPDAAIPLKPVLVFFEDKKMKILHDYIESICSIRERSDITLDELTTLVEDLYLGNTGALDPAVPVTPEQDPEDAGPSTPGQPPPAEAGFDTGRPSMFDFVTEEPDGRLEEPPAEGAAGNRKEPRESPETSPDILPPPATRPNIALSLTFAGMQQSPAAAPGLPDLDELIPGNLRARFIRKIFSKNEQEYDDVIAALSGAETWKDASLLLNKLYNTSGLDPFDADVVEFTDTIYRRYMNAESEGQ